HFLSEHVRLLYDAADRPLAQGESTSLKRRRSVVRVYGGLLFTMKTWEEAAARWHALLVSIEAAARDVGKPRGGAWYRGLSEARPLVPTLFRPPDSAAYRSRIEHRMSEARHAVDVALKAKIGLRQKLEAHRARPRSSEAETCRRQYETSKEELAAGK